MDEMSQHHSMIYPHKLICSAQTKPLKDPPQLSIHKKMVAGGIEPGVQERLSRLSALTADLLEDDFA
jgi:hypothetical protein